jgi:hypothetical protein
MDPLTIASGVVAIMGLGVAWRMHRRACRAEAEVAILRGVLRAGRAGAALDPPTNQRPWRLSQPPAQSRRRQPP